MMIIYFFCSSYYFHQKPSCSWSSPKLQNSSATLNLYAKTLHCCQLRWNRWLLGVTGRREEALSCPGGEVGGQEVAAVTYIGWAEACIPFIPWHMWSLAYCVMCTSPKVMTFVRNWHPTCCRLNGVTWHQRYIHIIIIILYVVFSGSHLKFFTVVCEAVTKWKASIQG